MLRKRRDKTSSVISAEPVLFSLHVNVQLRPRCFNFGFVYHFSFNVVSNFLYDSTTESVLLSR